MVETGTSNADGQHGLPNIDPAQLRLLPWRVRALVRLLFWLLRQLQREDSFVRKIFHWLLLAFLYWLLGALLSGRMPQWMKALPAAQEIEKKMNEPLVMKWEDRDFAFAQTLTFGTAALGVVLLAQMITSGRPMTTPLWIAVGCFSLTLPILIAQGMAMAAQANPKATRAPKLREFVALCFSAFLWNALFWLVGFGAFLWSLSPVITIILFVGCYLGLRIYLKIITMPAALEAQAARQKEQTLVPPVESQSATPETTTPST